MGIVDDAITANPQRYTGYKAVSQEENNSAAQTTFTAHRESDGTGLGAYATIEQLEAVIEKDRQYVASLPQGLDYVPPINPVTPVEPPKPETPPTAP